MSQAYPRPRSLLLLLDDLGQAGLRLRRWRWRQGLHPSLALGRGGALNTRHNAGISVGLLRTAGIRVLAHGCCQHHARRHRPGLAAKESAGGAVPEHGRSLAGVLVPSPLVLLGGSGRRREGRGGDSPRGAASSSSCGSGWCGYRGGRRTGTGTGGVSGPTGAEGSPGAAALRVIRTAAPAHPRRSELGRRGASATNHHEPFGVASLALRSATPA